MIEKNLGKVVRELREGRRLSLRTLAVETGFSAAFLSQVENGQASPSISSLERIARALGVTMGEFFRVTEQRQTSVVRARERPGLNSEWSQAQIEVLGTIRPGRKIEGVVVKIQPTGTSGKHPHSHPHEQIAFMLAGRLELTLGEEQYKLSRGDAVTIRPGMSHLWRNGSSKPAQVLIVSAC